MWCEHNWAMCKHKVASFEDLLGFTDPGNSQAYAMSSLEEFNCRYPQHLIKFAPSLRNNIHNYRPGTGITLPELLNLHRESA